MDYSEDMSDEQIDAAKKYIIDLAEALTKEFEGKFRFNIGDRVVYKDSIDIGTVTGKLIVPGYFLSSRGEVLTNAAAYTIKWEDGLASNLTYEVVWPEYCLTESLI